MIDESDQSKQQLVIMGRDSPHIVLDGPALRVKKKQHADQIIPLRRINQISSFGACKWETNALLACSDNNIAIHFCRQDGSIRAQLQPPIKTSINIPIQQLLEKNLNSYQAGKEFNQRLKNLQRIAINRAQHRMAKQYSVKEIDSDNSLVDRIAQHYINSVGWRKLKHIFHALIKADVTSNLWRDNIQPRQAVFELHQIDLIAHLSHIIYCDIMPSILNKLIQERVSRQKINVMSATVVGLHQANKSKLQSLYNENLLDIHRSLLEQNNVQS